MSSKTFTGGDKLKARLAELSKKVNKSASVKVGFLEGSTYPDGTSTPMVAAIQEFGAPSQGIPPRPFFRNMIAKESPRWGDDLATALKANDYDSTAALNEMGELIAGQLKESILDTNSPELSEKTVAKKGFAKPLVDTAHMVNSVDPEKSKAWEVE